MAAPRKYPDELRDRAVRMAVDLRKDPATSAEAIKRVADQLGIHPEALRGWVKRAEIDEGLQPRHNSSLVPSDIPGRPTRATNPPLTSVVALTP